MKKGIFLSLLLSLSLIWCCGCTTPMVVYENVNVVRTAAEVQKDVSEFMLSKVVKPNTLAQARAVKVKQMEILERWDRCSKALYRVIAYLDGNRFIEYAASIAPGLGYDELTEILQKISSSVPTNVQEDITIIKTEEQALYDFNVKLLNALNLSTQEDLEKSISLLTKISDAHIKAREAIRLLGEYLDSTEYIKKEEALALMQQLKDAIKTLSENAGTE